MRVWKEDLRGGTCHSKESVDLCAVAESLSTKKVLKKEIRKYHTLKEMDQSASMTTVIVQMQGSLIRNNGGLLDRFPPVYLANGV